MPRSGAASERVPPALQPWMELTSWWVDPMVAASRSVARGPEQLLSQLVNGLALAFVGRRVELEARGHRGSASLDALHLLPRTGSLAGHRALIDLSDVDVRELRFDRVSVVVESVQIRPGVQPRLDARDIEVRASLSLDTAVRWVAPRLSGWSVRLGPGGALLARRDRGPEFQLDLRAADDVLRLEATGIWWRSRLSRLPRWLRLERRIPLDGGEGVRVVSAVRRGGHVELDLLCDGIDQPLDLGRLRSAMIDRGRLRP